MAGDGDNDFYGVMGLKKECSEAELRNAYKKLALQWHPDRCSAMGNLKYVEEAKKKFQAIQEAYSVLSDTNKRFLYDVGVYDRDDDNDENGMGDFLNEMATMINQNKSNENEESSFEELKELFDEMFESDIDAAFRYSTPSSSKKNADTSTSTSTSKYSSATSFYAADMTGSSLFPNYGECSNKRDSSGMMRNADKSNNNIHRHASSSSGFDINLNGFCFGVEEVESVREREMEENRNRYINSGNTRRTGTKQKISAGCDVSSGDYYGGGGGRDRGRGSGGAGGGGISAV